MYAYLEQLNMHLVSVNKLFGQPEAEIPPNMYNMSAILKIQNGCHAGISANVIID